MNAKDALQQLRYAADELAQLYETRAGVYEMLTSTTTRMSPTGTRGSGDVHRMDILGNLTDRVDEKIAALAALRVQAIDLIYQLDEPVQRSVLMAYYVNCRKTNGALATWDDVAKAVHLSPRQVQRIHADAMLELEKMSLNVTRGA